MRSIDHQCRDAMICFKWNQWFKRYHRPKFAAQHRREKKGQKRIENKEK